MTVKNYLQQPLKKHLTTPAFCGILFQEMERNMHYILIILAYAGPLSDTDSVAITTQIVANKEVCELAGRSAVLLAMPSTKVVKYSCTKNS